MNAEQDTVIPRRNGQQDIFLFRSAEEKAGIKTYQIWYVVRGEDVASSTASQYDGADVTNGGQALVINDEPEKDIVCPVFYKEIGEVSSLIITAYQDELKNARL